MNLTHLLRLLLKCAEDAMKNVLDADCFDEQLQNQCQWKRVFCNADLFLKTNENSIIRCLWRHFRMIDFSICRVKNERTVGRFIKFLRYLSLTADWIGNS